MICKGYSTRRLIVSMNLTLDGFYAGPNGELDWHFPYWNEEMMKVARAQLWMMDTILVGRVTYQSMAGYWPFMPADDFSDMMNSYAKVVFSSTLTTLGWNNSRLVNGAVEKEVKRLKREPGRDIIIYGSASVVSACLAEGLVDEFFLWLHPVLIGSGRPLFRDGKNELSLRLVSSQEFSTGVVLMDYGVRR